MASRGLPGFLRRSLRVKYDDDEEEDATRNNNSITEEDVEQEASYNDDTASLAQVKDTKDKSASSSGEGSADIKSNGVSSSEKASTSIPPVPPVQPPIRSDSHVSEISQRSDQPDTDLKPRKSYRESQFDNIIKADTVSLATLRPLAWNGIPPIHRAMAWKLLLGYIPTNASRREHALHRKRAEYQQARRQHYDIDDDTRTMQEQETLRQVLVDVPRTAPEVPLFRNDKIRRLLSRVLYIWAMRHPASSYVQGINDLATPLLVVFLADYYYKDDDDGTDDCLQTVLQGHVMNHLTDERLDHLEADIYGCLTNLLAGIQDHYTADQPGVQRMVMRVQELVQRIDADLCSHLEEQGIQFLQFAFKWMNCLLLREFDLPCVVRLWDTYLSETNGFEHFHVYVCAAFLCQFSTQLQTMAFEEMFGFLQDMPTSDWGDVEIEMLLSQAYVLSTLFRGSDAHLIQHS